MPVLALDPVVYLVIDTETTGLFDFAKPADADGQPRMASIARIGLNVDLEPIYELHDYIKPDGWEMGEEAGKVNSLTTAMLVEKGKPAAPILAEYAAAIDEGIVIVAFNASFDAKVLRGEMRRYKIEDRYEKTNTLCTMQASTEICKIPHPKKRGYKWPKLHEACAHFGIKQEAAHTALDDARACAELFRKLISQGVLPKG